MPKTPKTLTASQAAARLKNDYFVYGKLEAARVKIVQAIRLLDEARMNIGESGQDIRGADRLISIQGGIEIIGQKVISAMNKIEGSE
jgi:hypothetical protein